MEIKIEVSDEMFMNVAENSLNALTPEQVTDICKQALLEYFRKDNYDAINKLIIEKGKYSWDDNISIFGKQMLEKCDYSDLQEVVDKSIEMLKNNYKTLMERVVLNAIVSGLTSNCNFYDSVRFTLSEIMNERN